MKFVIHLFLFFLVVPLIFAGVINHESFYSTHLQQEMKYNIYLPDNYKKNINHPVVYLLHGASGNENDWASIDYGNIGATADMLIKNKSIPPLVIVMPDGFTDSWYVDSLVYQMESAIIDDLIPYIEGKYSIDKNARYIAGLSMGGYGSLRFALLYPDYFKGAGLLSPAIYDPLPPENSSARTTPVFHSSNKFDEELWQKYNYTNYLDEYLYSNIQVPMYIVSGDDDVYNVEYYSTILYEKLKKNKKPAELRIVDGGHSWDVWKDNIDEVLLYFFNKASQP
jgi:enterochelin esterase-like enzyme